MSKKQVISTEITSFDGKYFLVFKVNNKKVKKVEVKTIYEAVSLRELFANLPSAKVKLMLLLEYKLIKKNSVKEIELEDWFDEQIELLDNKAKNKKNETKTETEQETFDLDSYLSKFGL